MAAKMWGNSPLTCDELMWSIKFWLIETWNKSKKTRIFLHILDLKKSQTHRNLQKEHRNSCKPLLGFPHWFRISQSCNTRQSESWDWYNTVNETRDFIHIIPILHALICVYVCIILWNSITNRFLPPPLFHHPVEIPSFYPFVVASMPLFLNSGNS